MNTTESTNTNILKIIKEQYGAPAVLPTIDLVAKIETTLTGMTTEEADTIRADLSSIIRKAKAPKETSQEKVNILKVLPTK